MFDYGFGEHGPIFQYSLFWDASYCTKDPNIVKVSPSCDVIAFTVRLKAFQTVLATDFANYEKGAHIDHNEG